MTNAILERDSDMTITSQAGQIMQQLDSARFMVSAEDLDYKEGTKAMTSISGYSSHTVDSTWYSYSTTEVEALSTHTTLVELETGSSADPFVLGNQDSPTIIEGLISLGGPAGPGIMLHGGKGSAVLAHLIPSLIRTTSMKRELR